MKYSDWKSLTSVTKSIHSKLNWPIKVLQNAKKEPLAVEGYIDMDICQYVHGWWLKNHTWYVHINNSRKNLF